MVLDTYNGIKLFYSLVTGVFFREIKVSGTHNVPTDKPCIFIVAPHANQFVDPGLVIISNPRRFSPLMAQASFKRKIVGTLAKKLNTIPVIRPQDLAVKGAGKLVYSKESRLVLNGQSTQFTQQVSPRDIIALSKTLSFEVAEVVSDTELKLKKELTDEAVELLHDGGAYKIIPHIDQSVLFEKVHDRLNAGECIVIFPEGGSHDRSEMLPLKAGFAIMALGAMAQNKDLDVKIVPVGLNYFHPHRFRSRAVVSYGAPISISSELVQSYAQGGTAKREAIASLLEAGYEGLKSVTVNAPNYDTLMTIAAARRLYKPAMEHKLTIDQVVELNRRFLLGYKYFEKDPRLVDLLQRVKAYNDTLKYFGLKDHQVAKTETSPYSAAPVLISRLLKLSFLALFGFPSLLINSPLIILIFIISQKKQEEALAGSSVKIAARDVLATWKILVTLVGMPALYGFYSILLFSYLYYHGYEHSFLLSLSVWVIFPFIQYACVLVLENSIDIFRSLNPLFMSLSNPDGAAELRWMRENLSETITKFVDENGSTALSDFDRHKFDALEPHEKAQSRSILRNLNLDSGIIKKWLDDKQIFSFSTTSSTSTSDAEEGE
ncbi:uncharacterized protein RHIMIDRAFT_204827 [Rhizopus microsporus ATCC 52813]|uniref:Phospholipid/glycerol acyltransferase domain-containing protein n=2 Tax=Rhizopus microsporus TaxID=58291 RepID=A0A2G4SQU1_RHIZD|nr:uncharacterized protein RHIMIDRAFT_204827 [Rhizopus microsporus ATCC 52813]PHZ11102.1 hypothetical protein RHIMIDRAFT_204827 [Rhizopus microsporus ATCC 52813]